MRIALLPSAYPPAVGGVEELSRHLALTLRAGGDEVEIWTGKDRATGAPEVTRQDGLVVRRFAFALPRAHPAALVQAAGRGTATLSALARAVGRFGPDVLHVQCFAPQGLYATALSRLTGVPLVLTLQGETVMDDHDVFSTVAVFRRGLRDALARARAVSGCSAYTLADAEARFGLDPAKATVIFNGVVPAGPAPDGRPPGFPSRYVLGLGRVVEKKGFDLLLRAYAASGAARGAWNLVLAGDGPARPGLEALAAELGLAGRVHFPGRLDRDDVRRAMAGAEIFVMPSRLEPFGIVVLEAWDAGRPVVATDRGGTSEFVTDGEDGLLVDPNDLAALAGALDRLADDPALARRLGRAGRAQVPRFSWDVLAQEYRDLYARAVPVTRTGGRSPGP